MRYSSTHVQGPQTEAEGLVLDTVARLVCWAPRCQCTSLVSTRPQVNAEELDHVFALTQHGIPASAGTLQVLKTFPQHPQ